jgi:hypothetical protein
MKRAWLLAAFAMVVAGAAKDTCVDCHSIMEGPLKVSLENDVH